MVVPITTLPAPSNSVLRFFIGQITIFGLIDQATENVKNMIWTMENLSISLDRDLGVVLGRGLQLLEQAPEELQDELLVKYPIWEVFGAFWRHTLDYQKSDYTIR
jgi:hypothetical protein